VVRRLARVLAAVLSLGAAPSSLAEACNVAPGWLCAEAIARGHLARRGRSGSTLARVETVPYLFRVDRTQLLLVRDDRVVPTGGGLPALDAHLRASDRSRLVEAEAPDLLALVDYFGAFPDDLPRARRVAYVDSPDAPALSPCVVVHGGRVRLFLVYVEPPPRGAPRADVGLTVERRELEIEVATGAARWVASRDVVPRPERW
jgi:hypothetical protein